MMTVAEMFEHWRNVDWERANCEDFDKNWAEEGDNSWFPLYFYTDGGHYIESCVTEGFGSRKND